MSVKKERKLALPPVAHTLYPRAHAFYALSNCTASFQLSVASGEEPPTPFSDRGTEVHQLLSGALKPEDTDEGVREEAARLQEHYEKTFSVWLADQQWTAVREKRLWLRQGLRPLYSGQPDLYSVNKAVSLVLLSDYKTGWHPLDDVTATNCQIRAYVPLIDADLKGRPEAIVAAIHKPGKQSSPAVFDRESITQARDWAIEVVARATEKGPKTPTRGPWCKYCSGKVLCPLWRDQVDVLATFDAAPLADIPDTQLRDLAPRLALAATVIERLQARLEARVRERPDFYSDWHLVPGEPRRKISDTVEAYNSLVVRSAKLSAGEFLVSCRAVVGDIESRLRKKHKLTVQKTKLLMNDLLEGIIELKANKDKLIYDPLVTPSHDQQ